MPQISDAGLALIEQFEGYEPNWYRDAVGVRTIGYGWTGALPAGFSAPLSKAEARRLLRHTVQRYADGVLAAVRVPLAQHELDALTAFAYNVGTGAFKRSTLAKKLNRGDRAGAAREFGRWNRAGGRVLAGLTRRRAAEAQMFQGPKTPDPAAPDVDAAQLSEYVSVAEFERSATARRRGIRNRMGAKQRARAEALCQSCVDPLRRIAGPLRVTSGYRSPALNRAIGGSNTSDHRLGRAVDLETALHADRGGLSVRELFDLARLLRLPFDQLILEFVSDKDPMAGWLHIGHRGGASRGQVLRMTGRYTAWRRAPVYTPRITAKVKAFQRARGLDDDGVIGRDTRAAARQAGPVAEVDA